MQHRTILAVRSVELSSTLASKRAVIIVVDALAQVQTAHTTTVIHLCTSPFDCSLHPMNVRFEHKSLDLSIIVKMLRGGSTVGRWTCDLQVAGSIPGRWLSRNIGQLSLASLRGR